MALFPIDEPRDDERVLLHNVSWAGYVSMRESLGRSVRLTYLHGQLEIMTVAFRLLALRDGQYHAIDASEILPELDHARIANYAVQEDQHAALVAFRTELRKS